MGVRKTTLSRIIQQMYAGGSSFWPLNTPILFEGDSNTDWAYGTTVNWAKRTLTKTGCRYYLPVSGDMAKAGSGIATATYGTNSMESRLSTSVPKIQSMVSLFGRCVIWFQIGTNTSAQLANDLTALASVVSQWRAAGAIVYANTCPLFGATNGYITGVNNWIKTPGNVDGYVDIAASADATWTGDGTHYNSKGVDLASAAVASFLNAKIVADSVYTSFGTGIVSGLLAGTSGTPGANATGQLATGWTCSRNLGDGSAVLAKTTLDGKTAQSITVTAGASDTYFLLTRSDTVSLSAGDAIDALVTTQISGTTDEDTVRGAWIACGGGYYPSNLGVPLKSSYHADMQVWRVYPAQQAGAASTLSTAVGFFVYAGKTATFTFTDVRARVSEVSAAVAPANTAAPVLSAITVGSTASCTNGTWTGSPAPTYTQQFYLGSTPIASSYVFQAGDVGQSVTCYVTATNTAGSASQVSNAVTVAAAATAPAQVTGLTLGTPTSTTQPLTWTAPSNGGSAITDYLVQYSTDNTNWTTFTDGTSTAASATVTGLTASTLYYYRVAAVNAVGTGSYSASVSGSTTSAGATTTTFDPTVNFSSQLAYSNGNLTVTNNGTNNLNAKSVAAKTSGKYYFEIQNISTKAFGVGLCDSATAAFSNGTRYYLFNGGTLFYSGGNTSGPTFGDGSVVCVAVDMDAKLLWIRTGAGNWNNSGTANPATGVGGVSISGLTSAYVYISTASTSGSSYTLRAASASWGYTAPSGFGEWTA